MLQAAQEVTTPLTRQLDQLAKAGASVKRLASTQTPGLTSAIDSDETETLTMSQMTAVSWRSRPPVRGRGDIPLDEFLMTMALASDPVVRDGEPIGAPGRGRPASSLGLRQQRRAPTGPSSTR